MTKPIAYVKRNGKDVLLYLNPDVSKWQSIQDIIAQYKHDPTFEWAIMYCHPVIDGLNMDKNN